MNRNIIQEVIEWKQWWSHYIVSQLIPANFEKKSWPLWTEVRHKISKTALLSTNHFEMSDFKMTFVADFTFFSQNTFLCVFNNNDCMYFTWTMMINGNAVNIIVHRQSHNWFFPKINPITTDIENKVAATITFLALSFSNSVCIVAMNCLAPVELADSLVSVALKKICFITVDISSTYAFWLVIGANRSSYKVSSKRRKIIPKPLTR